MSCFSVEFIFSLLNCYIHTDGPYGLTINSDNGQKLGDYFTFNKGEAVQLYCSADSNPPNIFYSWTQRADNSTRLIKYGRSLEVVSEKVTQKTEEYRCRALNNKTGKWKETHIFVIMMPKGKNECSHVNLQGLYKTSKPLSENSASQYLRDRKESVTKLV